MPVTTNTLRQVIDLRTDPAQDWRSRKLRLQGFRGAELVGACSTGAAASLGPATCGVASAGIVLTGSAGLAAGLATTALVGVVARNHPLERLYNALARRTGRPEIPPSRAAKRFACALAANLLIGLKSSIRPTRSPGRSHVGADGRTQGLAGSRSGPRCR